MRPLELRVSGVASYSEDTTVDFRDADLFALVGPTGSGKSSLVDAIVFALYGAVPRHGQKALTPFVTVGAVEAAVVLTFAHRGATYRVARALRRQAHGGVTSRGSRLERLDGEAVTPLAADSGTTDEVERLIGLDFGQFTRSVVLPQGRFADFLHAVPANRQALIEQLMALDWIDEIRGRAVRRHARASERLDAVDRSIDELAPAGDDDIGDLAKRRDRLDELAVDVTEAEPKRHRIEAAIAAASIRHAELEREHAELSSVVVPKGLDQLDERRRTAETVARDAREAAEVAEAAAAQVAGELAALDIDSARRAVAGRDDLTTARKEVDEAVRLLDHRRTQLDDARRIEAAARADLELALAEVDAVGRRSRVAELLHGHDVGDPCPVCERPLDTVPTVEGQTDLDHAQRRRVAAAAELDAARTTVATLSTSVAKGEQIVEERRNRASRLADDLAKGLSDLQAQEVLAAHSSLSERAAAAERDAVARRADERRSIADRDRLRRELDGVWSELDTLAGRVGMDRRDGDIGLVDAWRGLAEAIATRRTEIGSDLVRVAADIAHSRADAEHLVAALTARAAELGLPGPAVDIVARAAERARLDHDDAVRRQRRRSELAAERERVAVDVDVSAELARHLRSDGFRRWLVAGTMERLAERASEHLDILTGGAFRLTCSDDASSTFQVIDVAAGGVTRTANSLSGGETFLASLALALALSDEVAAGSHGGHRLDTLLIDEGFGSLDGDTLELVADALERLGDTGRMVGIVTHVADLAERLPVRYEIRRDGTSRVTRIDGHD